MVLYGSVPFSFLLQNIALPAIQFSLCDISTYTSVVSRAS